MSHLLWSQALTRRGRAYRHSAAAVGFGAIALAFLTLCCGVTLLAADAKDRAATRSCAFADTDFDPSTDVHALEGYQHAIAGLLKQGKFAELDCVANSVRSTKARFSGGAWKLHKLYAGLDEPQLGFAYRRTSI